MSTKPSPIGHFIRACDGGWSTPLDRAGLDYIQAQAAEGGKKMEVRGVALRYGVVGHFGFWGATRIADGAVLEAPGKHRKYRDILGLYGHDAKRVMARVGNNTMGVEFGDKQIEYWMTLNSKDAEAQSVWAKLQRGDVNAASVGILIRGGEYVRGTDNGLDSETAGEEIDIFEITEAYLIEVSLVAQGAFAGATSMPANEAVAGAPEEGDDLVGALTQLREAIDAESENDGIVEGDDEPGTDPEGASAGVAEGDSGDDQGSGGEALSGSAESDDGGGDSNGFTEEAQAELNTWLTAQEEALRKRGIET